MCAPLKPIRLRFPATINSRLSMSIHSHVNFSPWLAKIAKRDKIFRMIGKTRAARGMSPSAKKRVALSIMPSSLRQMSIGARQYAMAVALQEAQKKVKVQPIGFFTMGDGGDEEELPVRRIHWGNVDTKLVSYDIPIEIEYDANPGYENKKMITTERQMKIEKIVEVSNKVKSNLREHYNEKQAADATSMT
tara:strand:- start:9 stop:581 length:573 start_codon:yes stop_codon:yes gene_type:complete